MIRIDAMWLAADPIDMRAGADRLLARVVQVFGAAQAHHGYLFANARGTRIKLLVHDGFGASPVGGDVGLRGVGLGQQGRGQSLLAPVLDRLPVKASGMGQANILGHSPFGDVEGGCDLLVREVGLPLQADTQCLPCL